MHLQYLGLVTFFVQVNQPLGSFFQHLYLEVVSDSPHCSFHLFFVQYCLPCPKEYSSTNTRMNPQSRILRACPTIETILSLNQHMTLPSHEQPRLSQGLAEKRRLSNRRNPFQLDINRHCFGRVTDYNQRDTGPQLLYNTSISRSTHSSFRRIIFPAAHFPELRVFSLNIETIPDSTINQLSTFRPTFLSTSGGRLEDVLIEW